MIPHDCRWINTVGTKGDYYPSNPLHTRLLSIWNKKEHNNTLIYLLQRVVNPIPIHMLISHYTRFWQHTPNILTESNRLCWELCCTVVRNPWIGRKWLWERKHPNSLWKQPFQWFEQTHNSSNSRTYSSQPAFNTHKQDARCLQVQRLQRSSAYPAPLRCSSAPWDGWSSYTGFLRTAATPQPLFSTPLPDTSPSPTPQCACSPPSSSPDGPSRSGRWP